MTTDLYHTLASTLEAGGWLMLPLIATAFAIWWLYFSSLTERQPEALRRNSRLMAALVAAAPLIGLLGTVLGMIETFDAVAARDGDTEVLVAKGISKALITTQAGLVAAIPGTFAILHLNARKKKLAKP